MDANNAAQLQLLQQQLQDLQQQLQAVQAQQAQPGGQHPPPPPQQVIFAREPAQANQAGLLNFADRNDIEFHKSGSKALPGDAFGNDLLTRRYGEITREQVRNAALLYQAAQGRDAQNASILFNFLDASINDIIRARVNTDPTRYILELPGPVQGATIRINDGTCFLKAIIDHTYTNTLSTAAAARSALSSLDSYMAKLPKYDITKFNLYVKEQLHELAACGQTTNDLVMNLFKGYFKCRDNKFVRWLERIRDDYITRTVDIDPNGLAFMEQVENYYKDRLRTSEWMKLDEDQETILALKAQLQRSPLGNCKPQKTMNSRQKKSTGRLGTGVPGIRSGQFIPPPNAARTRRGKKRRKRRRVVRIQRRKERRNSP
mmetsp:Transcript_9449/g.13675  ORF Transcript_9449/g.13675 Transcript_9449/m.13675 type:complete len:374 (-) Transcript_9449:831-1952(-)